MKENQTGQEPKSQEQLRETQPSVVSGEPDKEVRFTLPAVLPVLPLADTVIYPLTVQPLAVGQERSIRLIDDVMRGDRLAALVAQKSADIEQAGPDDLFRIGTVVRILRMLHMPDGTVQMIVQGLDRVEIGAFTQEQPYLNLFSGDTSDQLQIREQSVVDLGR